jgi:hypothetical protein
MELATPSPSMPGHSLSRITPASCCSLLPPYLWCSQVTFGENGFS